MTLMRVKDREAWHVACNPQGRKESDMTEQLNDNNDTSNRAPLIYQMLCSEGWAHDEDSPQSRALSAKLWGIHDPGRQGQTDPLCPCPHPGSGVTRDGGSAGTGQVWESVRWIATSVSRD